MSSGSLKEEIEQAASEATKDMIIDPETLGGSLDNKDATVPGSDVDQLEAPVDDAGDTVVKEAVASEEKKVWKKPEDSDDDPVKDSDDESEENSETDKQHEGEVDATPGDGEEGDATVQKSPDVLARAHAVGITMTDASTFKNDKELSDFVTMVENGIRAQAQVEAEAEARNESVKKAQEEDQFKDLELNPDDYDENVVKLFGKMKEVLQKQSEKLNELSQQQVQSAQYSNEAVQREVTQWFDKKITDLGDEFADTLGEGSFDSLLQGSPQLAKRDEIATQMSIMLAGYDKIGQSPPSREKVFADAAQVVLGSELSKVQERTLQKKLADRKKGHISRAGGRTEKIKLSADEEAARIIEEKYGK